jgi:nicotinamide mononucleotide adenylyltransferase
MVDNVGLAIMRLQPAHLGHTSLINDMIENCQTAIVGLGSAQVKRQKHDPWTIEERQVMLRNVYGDRIKIVPLADIGAVNPIDWTTYVLDKIQKLGLPAPTEYHSGSEADTLWYRYHFYMGEPRMHEGEIPEHFYTTTVSGKKVLRRLFLHYREQSRIPSGTELRMFLETRYDGWKKWVPRVNHELIEATYPDEFKVPLK